MRLGSTNITIPAASNTLALVTRSGVIVVDPKLAGTGQAIRDALRTVTARPVTTIINTHFHEDHTGGNIDFPEGVEIIAHENTRDLMRTMPPLTGGRPRPNIFAESSGRGLPTRTFKDRLTLGSGDEQVELYYFGRAHTNGDTWVVFPSQRVVATGDVFAFKTFPIFDTSNGGTGTGYADTIAKAVAALPNIDVVIGGHTTGLLSMADLQTYGTFVGTFVRDVQAAKMRGETEERFTASWVLPDIYSRAGYANNRPYVGSIWNETR